MSVEVINQPVLDPANDEPMRQNLRQAMIGNADSVVDMTAAVAMLVFCKLVFVVKKDGWTYHGDLKASDRILRAAGKAHRVGAKHVALDQADHDWLTKKLEDNGALVFGCHTAAVRDAIGRVKEDRKT